MRLIILIATLLLQTKNINYYKLEGVWQVKGKNQFEAWVPNGNRRAERYWL